MYNIRFNLPLASSNNKYLEKKVNRGGQHFTTSEIIGTLRDMNFLSINGEGYIPTYTRTDLTNNLHGSAGFRTDYQIVTKKQMRSIIAQTKKRDKDNAELLIYYTKCKCQRQEYMQGLNLDLYFLSRMPALFCIKRHHMTLN